MDEKCLKAAVLEGKAYVGLRQYERAMDSYEKAKTIDARKERVVNEYIERARIRQTAELEEQTAGQTFEASADTGVVSIIEKLRKPAQPLLYYIGGLELVRARMKSDSVARTLFRSSGGFDLASSHPELGRCLNSDPDSLSASDVQLVAIYLAVLYQASIDNEDNQCHVLAMSQLPQQLIKFIECLADVPACRDISSAAVNLLLYLSLNARNRSEMVLRYGAVRLISLTFKLSGRLGSDSVAVNSQRLICNLAVSDRLRREIRGDDFELSVLSSFDSLLYSESLAGTEAGNLSVKTMVNLCGDDWLRRRMSDSCSTWSACVSALTRLVGQPSTIELVSSLVGLLANMALNGTHSATQHDLVLLSGSCIDLVTQFCVAESAELVDKCYLLLRRVFASSAACVQSAVDKRFIDSASRDLGYLLRHQREGGGATEILGHCLAAVTSCTGHSDVSRQQLTNQKPSVIRLLVELVLGSDQCYSDLVLGNAVLCLGHCVTGSRSALGQVTAAAGNADLIMSLLVLARDQAKPTVQHNCAILISKLVQQHQPYLDRLRELHGLEILHTVLKHFEH